MHPCMHFSYVQDPSTTHATVTVSTRFFQGRRSADRPGVIFSTSRFWGWGVRQSQGSQKPLRDRQERVRGLVEVFMPELRHWLSQSH